MDLLVLVVLIRGVLAQEILNWLRQGRKAVIWRHFWDDHDKDIYSCLDARCATL